MSYVHQVSIPLIDRFDHQHVLWQWSVMEIDARSFSILEHAYTVLCKVINIIYFVDRANFAESI